MKILVADDDKVFGHVLTEVFRKRGWVTVIAVDGMQALMLAKRAPYPDLILLDLAMPGGTGLVTLERLRASIHTMEVPVMVVTGSTDPAMLKAVEDLGAIAFVKKPVDPETLAARIEQRLGDGEGRDLLDPCPSVERSARQGVADRPPPP